MIRPARPEDAETIRTILAENGQCIDGVTYEQFSPVCLVAVRDGAVVGMIQATLSKPYSVITEMAVVREHQRKGYGVRLLQHLETVLREYGVVAWVAATRYDNSAVIDQMERYGARMTGASFGFVRSLA